MTTRTVTAPTRIGLLATPLSPLRFLMARGGSREGVRSLRFSTTALRLPGLHAGDWLRLLGLYRWHFLLRLKHRRCLVRPVVRSVVGGVQQCLLLLQILPEHFHRYTLRH